MNYELWIGYWVLENRTRMTRMTLIYTDGFFQLPTPIISNPSLLSFYFCLFTFVFSLLSFLFCLFSPSSPSTLKTCQATTRMPPETWQIVPPFHLLTFQPSNPPTLLPFFLFPFAFSHLLPLPPSRPVRPPPACHQRPDRSFHPSTFSPSNPPTLLPFCLLPFAFCLLPFILK